MNRRGFLGSILAACAAPAIARADSLMRIVPMETTIETVNVVEVMFGNQLRNASTIAAMALRLVNEHYNGDLKLLDVSHDAYRDAYTARIIIPDGAQMKPQGDTIKIRMPNRYERRA